LIPSLSDFIGSSLTSFCFSAGADGARGAVRAEIVDAVDRQKIGKPRARLDPALDRADRAAAQRRGAIY
jgi:hypothetical protein